MKDIYGVFTEKLRELEGWTFEDAKQAEEAWMASKGVKYPHGSAAGVSPVSQWHAWTRDLPALEEKYRETQNSLIMFEAVVICINFRLPIPPWCAVPLKQGVAKVKSAETRSWNDAFGVTGKGARLHDQRMAFKYKAVAVQEVLDRVDTGETVTKAIRVVESNYAFGEVTLTKWYYEHLSKYPLTRVLAADGAVYQKSTGTPDSQYRKVEDLTERPKD